MGPDITVTDARNVNAAGQFFLQMSGAPGAGKSTIAAFVGERLRVPRLDHDVVKSALMRHHGFDNLGAASYDAVLSLADAFLAQDLSVVVDSPCYYSELLERGQTIAAAHQVRYLYIECRAPIDVLDSRMRGRPRLPSQRSAVEVSPDGADPAVEPDGRALFATWIAGMKRPEVPYLVLDTSRPLEVCHTEVLEYLSLGHSSDIPAWNREKR